MRLDRRAFALSILACAAFGAPVAHAGETVTNYIIAVVPEGAGKLYITGSADQLGPWKPKGYKMFEDGRKRIYAFEAEIGYTFEYKFTRGSWDSEALGEDGRPLARNHKLTVEKADGVFVHEVPGFKDGKLK